jgi:phenylalanyl-tRNA synthetase beta chain
MKLSINWLKEILPEIRDILQSEKDIALLAHRLTMAGLEVDSISNAGSDFAGVVVGKIVRATQHPDADRLKVCEVDVGGDANLQIVCGAANARADINVAVAMIGAKLADFKIKKSKLRGVESNGMLCSLDELGLPGEIDGIMELPNNAPLGQDLREFLHLDDVSIEIELTPNRGDCLSMFGLAREIAVLYDLKAPKLLDVKLAHEASATINAEVKAIDACSKYQIRQIKNINNKVATPDWLSSRLTCLGVRTINPVVDVCNYIMLYMGQPMHAFASNKLEGAKLTVRYASEGEKLVLLDEKEISLNSASLVIADAVKVVALAGVMGGLNSAVDLDTTDIIIESAVFNSVPICLQARKSRISSDSSFRFERGIDELLTSYALDYATLLLQQIVGGEIEKSVTAGVSNKEDIIINLRRNSIKRHLGIDIIDSEVVRILKKLGFACSAANFGWQVTIPSFRHDVRLEIDIIEELVRIYGYDNVPEITKAGVPSFSFVEDKSNMLFKLKTRLAALGYKECINYSFCDSKLQALITTCSDKAIKLIYPLSDQLAEMRLSMWPQLLNNAIHNKNRQLHDLHLFEIGACYFKENNKVIELQKLALLLTGNTKPKQWGEESSASDFFSLKGDLTAIFTEAGLDVEYRVVEHMALHPGQSAGIFMANKQIGLIGVLHPQLGQELDLDRAIMLAEIDLDPLLCAPKLQFTAISKYPAVHRDLAFLVNEDIAVVQLLRCISEAGGKLLRNVSVFDIYKGAFIQKNEKSIALGLTFLESSRTLIDEEINELIQGIVREVESQLGAKLRT